MYVDSSLRWDASESSGLFSLETLPPLSFFCPSSPVFTSNTGLSTRNKIFSKSTSEIAHKETRRHGVVKRNSNFIPSKHHIICMTWNISQQYCPNDVINFKNSFEICLPHPCHPSKIMLHHVTTPNYFNSTCPALFSIMSRHTREEKNLTTFN